MVVLPVEREIGPVVGVDEEVRVGLEERHAPFEETEVYDGDQIDSACGPVAVEGSVTTAVEPESEIVLAIPGVQHHLIVISQDRHEAAAVGQGDQLVENAFAVEATIYEITERHDGVFGLRIDGLDECGQGGRATVNVTNGYCSTGHGSPFLFHDEGQMERTFLKQARELTGSIFETRLQKEKPQCNGRQDWPRMEPTFQGFQNK